MGRSVNLAFSVGGRTLPQASLLIPFRSFFMTQGEILLFLQRYRIIRKSLARPAIHLPHRGYANQLGLPSIKCLLQGCQYLRRSLLWGIDNPPHFAIIPHRNPLSNSYARGEGHGKEIMNPISQTVSVESVSAQGLFIWSSIEANLQFLTCKDSRLIRHNFDLK